MILIRLIEYTNKKNMNDIDITQSSYSLWIINIFPLPVKSLTTLPPTFRVNLLKRKPFHVKQHSHHQ